MNWWLTDFGHKIGQADPAGIVLAIVFLAAAAFFVVWRCWHHLYKARTIEDIPTAKAGSAHQGYVELEGIGKLMSRRTQVQLSTKFRRQACYLIGSLYFLSYRLNNYDTIFLQISDNVFEFSSGGFAHQQMKSEGWRAGFLRFLDDRLKPLE